MLLMGEIIMNKQKHWQNKYQTDSFDTVSWYQKKPTISLNLIKKYAKNTDAIIDAGAGASYLVDNLLQNNFENITLLDISEVALNITKQRLNNAKIKFIVQDVLDFKNEEKYNIWHDRAVFHFVKNKIEQQKYLEIVYQSLVKNGIFILATFAVDGPKKCSNLEIYQYDKDIIIKYLGDKFKLLEELKETHITPNKKPQLFNYFVLQKI